MPIDPNAVGATADDYSFTWTDRDTMLYALGVGCGTDDLAFTTDNSHDIAQQVLPTYAVVACIGFAALGQVGDFNFGLLLHGSQQIRLFAPLQPAGALTVASDVVDIQDKGEGKNAIIVVRARGTDPTTAQLVVETQSTFVIRGAGGFGGTPGERPTAPEIPDRTPDSYTVLPTREDQPLIYRLSGDRNPLHSDPWFAQTLAGFPKPIMHGLCTYGFAGRALVAYLGGGDASAVTAIGARFTSPVFPGETLTTSIWRTEPGHAVFQTQASAPDGSEPRVVLSDGTAEYSV